MEGVPGDHLREPRSLGERKFPPHEKGLRYSVTKFDTE